MKAESVLHEVISLMIIWPKTNELDHISRGTESNRKARTIKAAPLGRGVSDVNTFSIAQLTGVQIYNLEIVETICQARNLIS